MAWVYNAPVSSFVDLAGKTRVTASIKDGAMEQWIILKFQFPPNATQIKTEALKVCDKLNNPDPPPPDYKAITEQSRAIIDNPVLTDHQKVVALDVTLPAATAVVGPPP